MAATAIGASVLVLNQVEDHAIKITESFLGKDGFGHLFGVALGTSTADQAGEDDTVVAKIN